MCQMVSSIYTCKFVNLPVPLKYKQKYIPFNPNKPGHLRYREGGKREQLGSHFWVLKNAKTQFWVSSLRLSKVIYNSHYGNGPLAMFTSYYYLELKGKHCWNPIVLMGPDSLMAFRLTFCPEIHPGFAWKRSFSKVTPFSKKCSF